MRTLKAAITALILLILTQPIFAQIINIGNGSYTETFPGVDAAGRNGFPSGTPFTIGKAATKPVPTNDWWSNKVKNAHSSNLFNYPFTLKTVNQGLVISYIPWGPIDDILPITVGVSNLNASEVNVSDFSDWTVSMDWKSSNNHLVATTGIGMPFVYFTKDSSDLAKVTITQGTVTVSNEIIIIKDARNGGDFAVYAPNGSTWVANGNEYTSSLNGKNYWSVGFIPQDAVNLVSTVNDYKKYAYVFPQNTETTWDYNEGTSVVTTHFKTDVEIKEGTDSTLLLGLLPHHWANLKAGSPSFTSYKYPTVRGEMKMMESNEFSVQNTFYGILPTLPYLDYYSSTFSPAKLNEKIKQIENDGLATWTDSYNEGQVMNRLIQTARVAELSGDTVALNKMITTVKTRLEDWLKVNGSEVAFLFHYNKTWSAMLGYPSGHGQDNNINDHHFHWGYFIHAASFIEQYQPGWANNWGDMINLLVRDAATTDRNDSLFPFLRNFSPYAGHSWANGFATFPQGNDQESTSESMQFNSSLIHWGSVTGNDSIRNLGIYLYTTEQSAIEEYWLNTKERNFSPSQAYSLVSRVWGNSYDNGTFWTADIAASYGIEMYPIHGGSLYLGHDTVYANKLWKEIEQNTGILQNEANDNLWHDVMWEYLAFTDPEKAIDLYNSYPDRNLKFGITDVQTYHWLHSMNVLGRVDASIMANHPLATAFKNNGDITYVGQNYGTDSITVTFSTGYKLIIPPSKLVTSKDISISGTLSSSFSEAAIGGSIDLELNLTEGTASKIEFYDGDNLLDSSLDIPHILTASDLSAGVHYFYARIYENQKYGISNLVEVIVGEQLPYSFKPIAIPGTFDPGHYDVFEGGNGNGVSYQDLSISNEGDFRLTEYVDTKSNSNEGNIVGWISPGEWLEYTVDVDKPGNYNLSFRYACGNTAGGGPITITSDGVMVKNNITAGYSGNWDVWSTKKVNNIPLKSGVQVLRVFFDQGELNMGKLTFSYSSPLTHSQPIANAGENQIVLLPQSTFNLDGTGSLDPDGANLTYEWTQTYGPSTLIFSNNSIAQPSISSLKEGVYKLKLKASNGVYFDEDEIYIISSTTSNVSPKVSLASPLNGAKYIDGETIEASVFASDFNDSVIKVNLYANSILLGSDIEQPYTWQWKPDTGTYTLIAVAFDSYGDSTISQSIEVVLEPAPPCEGTSWDGDFEYLFSDDQNNPTITFIPTHPQTGSPTCILYYGTDPGAMPGYLVTPNVPFRLTASKGTKIYFYYTYSYQGGGEKNNSANKNIYVVGTCKAEEEIISIPKINNNLELMYYPNPVKDILYLALDKGHSKVSVMSMSGILVYQQNNIKANVALKMQSFSSGIYLIQVEQQGAVKRFLVVKE